MSNKDFCVWFLLTHQDSSIWIWIKPSWHYFNCILSVQVAQSAVWLYLPHTYTSYSFAPNSCNPRKHNLEMLPALATVQVMSTPRQRNPPTHKPPPIPSQQHKEKLTAHQEKQQLIDDAVSEWYTYMLAKADDLGKCFNKKPRYFLNIFFQAGAKMVNHHQKTNTYMHLSVWRQWIWMKVFIFEHLNHSADV